MRTKAVKSEWALVVVHWIDAFDGENGWTDLEKYEPKEATVATVGWLIPDVLQGYVTLVNSYFSDEVDDPKTVGMPIHIPVGMILETKVLEQPTVLIMGDSDEQTLPVLLRDYQPSPGKFQDVSSRPNLPMNSSFYSWTTPHGRNPARPYG